jgi:HK97 family phage portal protein
MKLPAWIKSAYRRLVSASAIADLRNPTAWLLNLMAGQQTSAGVTISPSTALEVGAYYACLRLISGDVAKLPLWVYRRLPGDEGKERRPSHPVSRLIHDEFNPTTAAFTGRETLTQWAMGMGNGVALIERDASQNPTALWPIHPSRIRVEQDDKDPRAYWYEWRRDDATTAVLFPSEVLHLRGMGDGLWGFSVAQMAARTLGLATGTEEYASGFLGNGAWSSGYLSHPKALNEKALKNLRDSVAERHQGVSNAFRPMVLEEGMTWQQATVPPEDAQLLETRKFEVEEIARWFGVPPHKIGHLERATFSNIEHQAIDYVNSALMPWLIRWEQEIKRKLFGQRAGNLFAEHNVTALLRGDSAARAAYYKEMVFTGVYTPNEVRAFENMNASDDEGMDKHWMQSQMSPVDLLADPPEPEPVPPALTTGSVPPEFTEEEEPEEEEPEPEALTAETIAAAFAEAFKPEQQPRTATDATTIRALFEHTAARVVKREANATRSPAKKYADDWPAFVAWAEKFYAGHAAYLEEETRPIFRLCPHQPNGDDGWLQVWQDDARAAACERQRNGGKLDTAAATSEMTEFLMRLGRVEDTDA